MQVLPINPMLYILEGPYAHKTVFPLHHTEKIESTIITENPSQKSQKQYQN